MDAAVVGREVELSAADDFLSAIAEGFAALALEGEPGIGKTTLWREAIRRARARGFRVLACRPAQSEAKLSFAGLGDPLGPVPADVFDALPEPQRRGPARAPPPGRARHASPGP